MKIQTNCNVKVDGKIRPPNKIITVDDEVGNELIEGGFAVRAEDDESKDNSSLIEQIIALIPDLNEDDFTQVGHPKTDVLSKILGFDVKADASKAAWEKYQEQTK